MNKTTLALTLVLLTIIATLGTLLATSTSDFKKEVVAKNNITQEDLQLEVVEVEESEVEYAGENLQEGFYAIEVIVIGQDGEKLVNAGMVIYDEWTLRDVVDTYFVPLERPNGEVIDFSKEDEWSVYINKKNVDGSFNNLFIEADDYIELKHK